MDHKRTVLARIKDKYQLLSSQASVDIQTNSPEQLKAHLDKEKTKRKMIKL
jgi:hypothetical protein